MSQNVTAFAWRPERERAAELVAQGVATDEQIASEVGVTRRQLLRWKAVPMFGERVEAIKTQLLQALRLKGIAEKQNRIDGLVDRHKRLERVIEERALDPLMANVAGGKTGLMVASPMLVKVYEASGGGDDEVLTPTKSSEILHEFAVDTALLKEMRETEKQVAQELGQWSEKHEHTGKGGGAIGLHHTGKVDKGDGFDFAEFAAAFADVAAGRAGDRAAAAPGAGEPVDPAHAVPAAGALPDGAGP